VFFIVISRYSLNNLVISSLDNFSDLGSGTGSGTGSGAGFSTFIFISSSVSISSSFCS